MKLFSWLPQSFFARNLRLILAVVLFSQILTLGHLVAHGDILVDRQYAKGIALMVKAYWSVPPEYQNTFAKKMHMQRFETKSLPKEGCTGFYQRLLQYQLRKELGNKARVFIHPKYPKFIWVSAAKLGDGWIKLPLTFRPLAVKNLWTIVIWIIIICLLSIIASWGVVRQLNAPLKKLVFAAKQIGRGHMVKLSIDDSSDQITQVFAAFNQMVGDVERSTRERELMLAGISHDLRTPLTRLRLALEFLVIDKESANEMVRDIEDMDAILDQFMAFMCNDKDEELEYFDLPSLVQDIAASYEHQQKNIQLNLDPVPVVPLRRVSIKRLIVNLVENAFRYAGGIVDIDVYVAGDYLAPYVVLAVLDRGAGVDPLELNKLSTPFIQGNRARSGKGSGLGLAIVERIVRLHAGRLELLNREGGGFEARVYLPFGLVLPREALFADTPR